MQYISSPGSRRHSTLYCQKRVFLFCLSVGVCQAFRVGHGQCLICGRNELMWLIVMLWSTKKGLSPSECVMVSISHWLQTTRSEIMWRALSDAAIFVKEGFPKPSGSSSELWDIKKKNFWMWRSPKAQRPLWLPEERCVPQTTCWGLRKADLGDLEGGMGLGKATWRATVPPTLHKQELSRGGESRWDYFQQVWSLGQCYCILGETTQGNYSKGFRPAMTTLSRIFQQNP